MAPRMAASLILAALEDGHGAAVAQHHHASAPFHQLFQLGGDEEDGQPSSGQLGDQHWISPLAPTSIPRVGSSRRSRRGFRQSQRARSTFC